MVFLMLLAFRMDLFNRFQSSRRLADVESLHLMTDKDLWMRIYQAERPVGYTHRSVSRIKKTGGFAVDETVFMRINTMGLIQDIHLQTSGQLASNYTLQSFDFTIRSGRLSFSAHGSVSEDVLLVETSGSSSGQRFEIPLKNKPYLIAGMVNAVQAIGLKSGEWLTVDIIDPVTMGQVPVRIGIVGTESIIVDGMDRRATKIMIQFQGINQFAWIDENV